MKRQWSIKLILAVMAIGFSVFLLREDSLPFLTWWMLMAFMGVGFLPVCGRLFRNFRDKGWIFSKALGVAVCGYVMWALCVGGILPFTWQACVGVTLVCVLANLGLGWHLVKKKKDYLPEGQASLIFWEEFCFFMIFLMWTYLAGFHPAAYGTEKFMDYGFMEAMMRSTTLPATDMWYSEAPINYYYGGQYFAVFLTKLTFTRVEETYNLMRTLVAAFTFAMPCSLVYQLLWDRRKGKVRGRKWIPWLGGLLAGGAVTMAGNMHYVIYSKIIPLLQKLGILSGETDHYWFPDATRYIGYNPEVPDHTIHEFPCYSFVLGDLHAHVVNLMFVCLCIGLLYAWFKGARRQGTVQYSSRREWLKGELLQPHLLVVGWLLGMFQWTNYWDFVIYYVVAGGTYLFVNVIRHQDSVRRILATTLLQAAEIMVLAMAAALPFNVNFQTMVQGVALCENHSRFYQLLVLWGLPFAVCITFLAVQFSGARKRRREELAVLQGAGVQMQEVEERSAEPNILAGLLQQLTAADLFVVILSLCAMGLILLPEIVYVRDIYEEGSARANTMFKLTYQGYLMFGISMSYILFQLMTVCRRKALRIWGVVCTVLLLSTFGYFGNAVYSWFGEVWKPSEYQGLDATAFLEEDFPEDAGAIRWLKENIEGSPVVLEANGDSYTDYERVSAMTGLPTILGWYVHEWLWRSDVPDINAKSEDVKTIYTSTDTETVRALLEKYDVSYIFVGSMEREKYMDIQTDTLRSYGEVVYEDSAYGTFIVKVENEG